MLATVHALTAAAFINKFPGPASLPLIFVSHFLLDAIPHWDFGTNWQSRSKKLTGVISIAETVLGITLTYFLYRGKPASALLLLAILVSLLPDWLEAPWYMFFAKNENQNLSAGADWPEKIAYRIKVFEGKFHKRAQLPWGLVIQLVIIGLLIFLLSG